ncbi:hypothetical protein TNCT_620601 [Trichonephila clavata]|uniref:Uncharacterized protein n=1 Tax=Trichonephila clavata TaxID=2740835 RepID=A0A8X6F909_TRICU|nr:hypothetical protein TNCT_620601 [Trichonephila clavata]
MTIIRKRKWEDYNIYRPLPTSNTIPMPTFKALSNDLNSFPDSKVSESFIQRIDEGKRKKEVTKDMDCKEKIDLETRSNFSLPLRMNQDIRQCEKFQRRWLSAT